MKLCKCDIYLLFWLGYMMQNIVYPQGIINQIFQAVMILMGLFSIVEYFTTQNRSRPALLKASFILLAMFSFYGIYIIIFGDGIEWTSDIDYLKYSLTSLTPIFFFYVEAGKGNLTPSRIRKYIFVVFLAALLMFYRVKFEAVEAMNREEITNNAAYLFVSLIPMAFFWWKRPTIQYALIAAALMFIVMGMKRGAILIAGICTLIFILGNLRAAPARTKIMATFLSVCLIGGSFWYVGRTLETSEYFAARLEATQAGDASGRDVIYSEILNAVASEKNPIRLLFGHGANSTILYAGNYAHQDWLEVLCNNGLTGVVILFSFYFFLYRTMRKSKEIFPPQIFYAFFSLFFALFIKTLFSMSVQSMDLAQTMLIGFFTYWTTRPKLQAQSCLNR